MSRAETARRQTANRRRVIEQRRRGVNRTLNQLTNSFKRLNVGRDRYNLGTITNANNRYVSVRLSRLLIDRLKEIYTRTWTQRVEYVGSIPFTVSNTRNYVKFNQPTARTNQQLASVTPTQEELTQYIVYHTHPVPENETPLFTYPSEPDFRAYIANYPAVQANIILENQGYYVVDLLETNMDKPSPNDVVRVFNELMGGREFQRVRVDWSSLAYFATTPERWKRAINKYVDPIMRRQFGISVRYYTWNELGTITLLDKNVIMNIG
jgi:hypothetical protein